MLGKRLINSNSAAAGANCTTDTVNILSNIAQLDLWVGSIVTPGKESIITALPLYHIFSFTVNLMYFYSIGANNILITNITGSELMVELLN